MYTIYDSIKEWETNLSTFILISGNELNSIRASVKVFPVITHNAFKRRKVQNMCESVKECETNLYFHSMLWKWNCIYFLGHIKSLYFRIISWRWDWFHVSIRDRKWNVHDSILTVSRQMKHRSKKISLLSFYCLEMKLNPCKYSRMYLSR